MAPFMVDDFVGTLSDNDDISDEETAAEEDIDTTTRKRKQSADNGNVSKKRKHGAEQETDLDADFEFALDNGIAELDNYEALVGDAGNGVKVGFDVKAALVRHGVNMQDDEEGTEDENEDDDEAEEGDEDEDEDEDEDIGVPAAEQDGSASEAVADDEGVQEKESASDDEEEDTVEREKRDAFFAPEAPTKRTSQSNFNSMSLSRPLLKGLGNMGFATPTPIQSKAIPVALAGKDIVGGAVTGSGKTAAFLIPIIERLMFRPNRTPTTRVAIILPTRELALQCFGVAKKMASFTDITLGQAIGGLNQREQERQLKLRPDIVIATPGRFIDLERNSSSLTVHTIEILVLDEADRMLEDGFSDELNEILSKIPKSRQTMLFSATMTSKVDDLVRAGLQRPVRLLVDAQRSTVSGLVQEFIRLRPGREDKRLAYLMHLCSKVHTDRVIVFFRQKKDAHRIRVLFAACNLEAAELHGSMTQEQRIQAVEAFRSGKANFLLATDLASRGLDIKGIETVINYEAPQSHEIYLHRVGRTARAGRSGCACTLAAEPDRKVVKAAVKSGRAQGAQIRQRNIDAADVEAWHTRIENLQETIESILQEEKEERALQTTERVINRADNIISHRDEILSRPKKTWFESNVEKEAAKQKGAELLNGPSEAAKKKAKVKLSNKQKKKLRDKDERKEGRMRKKTKADREGTRKRKK